MILAQPKSSVSKYESAVSYKAQRNTLTHDEVSMEDNPAYEIDVRRSNDYTTTQQNVKMTENPSYAVP